MVLDADALNVLAEEPDILKSKKAPIIITPHPGEMARLMDMNISEIQKQRIAITLEMATLWDTNAM